MFFRSSLLSQRLRTIINLINQNIIEVQLFHIENFENSMGKITDITRFSNNFKRIRKHIPKLFWNCFKEDYKNNPDPKYIEGLICLAYLLSRYQINDIEINIDSLEFYVSVSRRKYHVELIYN